MNSKKTNNLTLLMLFVFSTIIMTLLSPQSFLSIRNLHNMGRQLPEFGILSLANMLAMITGGIDLSLVATANLAGVIAGLILSNSGTIGFSVGVTIVLAICAAFVAALLCGILNGALIAYAGVPAIIATLGTNSLFLGIAIAITKGAGILGFPDAFLFIGNGLIFGIPTQFLIFLAAVGFVVVLLNKTTQGFSMYMYGANPLAARFSGINNEKVLMKTYIMSALLGAVAAIIMISGVDSIRPGYGSQYLLLTVLIVVMGGVDPNGGFGTVLGVTLSILIVQILQSGLNILGFSAFFMKTSWGLLLLLLSVYYYARSAIARRRILNRAGKEKNNMSAH